ncbi:thioredoxin domain-containing protein [Deinococcus sonorensis]|uniref:Thioredoxin domain-containing protein n=2 Tax=Deinococcus sonorensis TaxID=309891 RepID=A0AAU7U9N8_9DEIO
MNRLAQETSPYLRQHDSNPVDWYPWGEAAFEAARTQDRPILLSVGYSTCHWCHVMAHESFEDEVTAAEMNRDFVCVKVDREERPDVDAIYMSAVQAMTGSGGWPMTVFLTPDLRPFYAGTYFPPHDMQGMPAFRRVLASVAGAWAEQRDKLEGNAEALSAHIRETSQPRAGELDLPPDLLPESVARIARTFDPQHGGFGGAPKFPSPTTLRFLLTRPDGQAMALATLRHMLAGGIYDQLGGGFHRYSVDAHWGVPHFEKMLYDNAQLTQVLMQAWQLSGDATFLQGAEQTLAYLEREMRHPQGGYYSAQDADSEGIEGKFFVWTPQETQALLADDAELFNRAYGVNAAGNFMDPHHPQFGRRSVLHLAHPLEELAADLNRPLPELEQRLERARATLLAAREQRVHPGTDDKILTSWNGLMLSALADAARLTGDDRYLQRARQNRDFILSHMAGPDGSLLHSFKDGEARVAGLLEDQAIYALGLVSLYQAGGDLTDLARARTLWRYILAHHWDEEAGVFYSTPAAGADLIARRAEGFDAAVLAPHPAAAQLAVWMARYDQDEDAARIARRAVQSYGAELAAAPGGMGGLLLAAAHLAAPEQEVAILGTPAARHPLERELARHALPFVLIAPAEQAGGLPVLEERGGEGVAYVCRGRACELPARDVPTLRQQLEALHG